MDQALFMWLSVVIISAVGTLAHFLYNMAHRNKIIGLFTAVNESTWEHIKIALTPAFLWGLIDGALYGANPNYFLAKIASLLVITFTIPVIFYAYRYFAKKSILPIDISIFYIAIILGQLAFFAIINLPAQGQIVNYFATIAMFIFFGIYMTSTLFPQHTFIFKDPVTGKYGFPTRTHQNPKKSK